jgi:CHAP domain
MTVLEFVHRRLGTFITAPGGVGGECVDLANQFLMDMYGEAHIYQNAVDWAGLRLNLSRWVPNGPVNAPRAGDLAVWGQNVQAGTGVNGHIALVLAANSMWLLTLDQNWPTGAPCELHLHPYDGVLGWQSHD